MVSKKAQDNEVNKKPAKASAKKGKESAALVSKAPLESENSGETKKKAAAAKSRVKTAKTEASVLKTHLTPVDEVLEIKAHNEEKKLAKAEKKSLSKAKANDEEGEKGNKAVSASVKHAEIKEKALKAEAKKFISAKVDALEEDTPSRACGIFNAWGRAYKNIFDFKSRTSRYEFWSFMLINFVLLSVVIWSAGTWLFRSFYNTGMINWWGVGIGGIILVVEFAVYLALIVRRLHDTGKCAWRGNFRPLVYSLLLSLALSFGGDYIIPYSDAEIYGGENTTAAILGIVYGLILLAVMFCYIYYAARLFLTAGFYEEDQEANAFGAPCFTEDCFKDKSFKYAALYGVLFVLNYALTKAFSIYLLFGDYYAGNGGY